MSLRHAASWVTFPLLMGGFVWLALLGLERGTDPAAWGMALTVLNFFVILGVEQLLPRDPAMSVFRDRQSLNDIGHGLMLSGVRPLCGALAVFGITQLGELRLASGVGTLWPKGPFAAQLALGLAVYTFADYWIHRSLHSFDRLWWFHAVHHDTPQMHILKSGRLHFGEEVVNAALKPLPLLLLGAPSEILVMLGLWIVFDGNLVHSNIDQRFPRWAHYFLPTVQLHNLHHAQDRRTQDSNFSGSTAVWDVLFRTFSHPARHPLGRLGLEESPIPPGFLAQLAFPFRAQSLPPAAARKAADAP